MNDERLDVKVIADVIVVLGKARTAGLSAELVRQLNEVRSALIRELDRCNQEAKFKSAGNSDT